MSIKQDLADIRNGKTAPIYLLFGEEDYFIQQVKSELQTTIFPNGDDDLGKTIYDMNTASVSESLLEASEMPFFSEKRLIFVENPSFLTAKKQAKGPTHNLDELLNYIKSPSDTSVYVLIVEGNVDGRSKIVKELKKQAKVIEAKPLQPQEVRNYVGVFLRNEKITYSSEALETLLELTNFELTTAMNEVQKLLVYISDTRRLDVEDVRSLVPKSLEQNIFDLSEFTLNARVDKAIALLDDLLLQGESIIALNAIFITKVRLMLQVQILTKQGYNQGNITEVLNQKPYPVKLAMQQARRFSPEFLQYVFKKLVEMDYQMKSSAIDIKVLFELFILDIGNQLRSKTK